MPTSSHVNRDSSNARTLPPCRCHDRRGVASAYELKQGNSRGHRERDDQPQRARSALARRVATALHRRGSLARNDGVSVTAPHDVPRDTTSPVANEATQSGTMTELVATTRWLPGARTSRRRGRRWRASTSARPLVRATCGQVAEAPAIGARKTMPLGAAPTGTVACTLRVALSRTVTVPAAWLVT